VTFAYYFNVMTSWTCYFNVVGHLLFFLYTHNLNLLVVQAEGPGRRTVKYILFWIHGLKLSYMSPCSKNVMTSRCTTPWPSDRIVRELLIATEWISPSLYHLAVGPRNGKARWTVAKCKSHQRLITNNRIPFRLAKTCPLHPP